MRLELGEQIEDLVVESGHVCLSFGLHQHAAQNTAVWHVCLDSMAATERRVVHMYLKDHPDVDTHSEGDEPFRRIVVTPVRSR